MWVMAKVQDHNSFLVKPMVVLMGLEANPVDPDPELAREIAFAAAHEAALELDFAADMGSDLHPRYNSGAAAYKRI